MVLKSPNAQNAFGEHRASLTTLKCMCLLLLALYVVLTAHSHCINCSLHLQIFTLLAQEIKHAKEESCYVCVIQ